MSVFPEYLVLGSDGKIGAYAREDILKADLAMNYVDGHPARGVFKLEQTINVSYAPTQEYAEWVEPVENLCPRHKREALPRPSSSVCPECKKEQNAATDQRR